MTESPDFRHWRWSIDQEQVLLLTFDRCDSSQNSLSQEVLRELDRVVTLIEQKTPRAVVLRSGKSGSFIVGADVSEFGDFTTTADAEASIRQVQQTFMRLENLPMPTLAVIDGPCLGGGLELALACRYRIAIDDESTSIGFPEIRLGIHPGFGGTVRSIRRIGAIAALQLMLSGRSLTARQAYKAGLIDVCIPRRVVENAIRRVLAEPPSAKPPSPLIRSSNSPLLRPIIARVLKQKVAAKADPKHYPAPNALIDLWRQYADDPEQMYQAEATSAAELLGSPTAQNLVRVFFLQRQLKGNGKGDGSVKRMHVVGAGSMGRDIAAWCALQGLQVSLQDIDNDVLARAIAAADQLFRKKLKDKHLIQAAHDRLMPDPEGLGIARADLVIEAVVEDAKIKKKVLQGIESQLGDDAMLATNTSSIPLEDLAQGLQRPERFLGIHFFNPVAKMPLVEVVRASATTSEVLDRAAAFVRRIKRLPLPVKSHPGFLVNRVLMPYLLAAVRLVEEGHDPETIDQAALAFGMPMGPLHLADRVGIDICYSVAGILSDYFSRPIPEILPRMVEQGRLGNKSGHGFYRYNKGEKRRSWPRWKKSVNQQELIEALLDPLFAEAQSCLDEGIVASSDLVDAGLIFGTGFAPFTGGPLHYLEQQKETFK